jgi:cyclic pyranopterin phosphate synthase
MVALADPKPLTIFPSMRGKAMDAYGRQMTYLRISLTDRCNFRCLYCMPEMGMKFQPRAEMLTDDELITVVGAFAELGFTKFRLTGGEPTIRPHLVEIVRAIKRFPGVEEVTMTTNALLLGRMAEPLAEAGLDRINVSLDTLDPIRFKSMTRGGRFDMVWEGILAAESAGISPIKINSVVIRGQNEHDGGRWHGL